MNATLTPEQFAQITGAFAAELLPYGAKVRAYVAGGALFLRASLVLDDRVKHDGRSFTFEELATCLVGLDTIGTYAGRQLCREFGISVPPTRRCRYGQSCFGGAHCPGCS